MDNDTKKKIKKKYWKKKKKPAKDKPVEAKVKDPTTAVTPKKKKKTWIKKKKPAKVNPVGAPTTEVAPKKKKKAAPKKKKKNIPVESKSIEGEDKIKVEAVKGMRSLKEINTWLKKRSSK